MNNTTKTVTTTTQGTTEKKRIMIPYNAAGQLVFDTFRSIAEKMIAVGNEATTDFIQDHFPNGRTIHKDYIDGQLRRVIERDDGEHVIIMYDYKKQDTTAAFLVRSPTNDNYLAGKVAVKTDSLDLFY